MNAEGTANPMQSRRQTNWDWRAAGNFICGGSGSGLLVVSAMSAGQSAVYRLFGCAGLALIALGLFCVWLEIGRPWRAMNVFLHAKTSWMTREALVAVPLFVSGALAVASGATMWIWLTALLALVFLYCQARILQAAKGIPAWRAPLCVPLLMATGLTEGAGLAMLLRSLLNGIDGIGQASSDAVALPAILLALLLLRALLWRAYRKQLLIAKAPRQAIAALGKIEFSLMLIGHWLAAGLLLLVLLSPAPTPNIAWLGALAGLLAAAGGWQLKYTVIVRAGFNQGYALPRLPVRGSAATNGRMNAKL